MLSHEYETIVIIRPDLDEAAVVAIIEKLEAVVTQGGGSLADRDDWGVRKLAYTIGRHQRGRMIRLHFVCEASLISEFERRIRIEDQVVRFMTVRLTEAVDVEETVAAVATVRLARETAKKQAEAEAEERRKAEEAAAQQYQAELAAAAAAAENVATEPAAEAGAEA